MLYIREAFDRGRISPTKVGDNPPSRRQPPPEITPLAKTFFREYMLLTFLYFLINAIRLDFFNVILHRLYDWLCY